MDKNAVDKFFRHVFCCHLFMVMNFASMQIPPEFLRRIKEKVPDTAILNGPWGGSWPVRVCQEEKGVFLVDGWEKFHTDHALVSGGLLLFNYCGNWCFDIEIFSHNGLEMEKILDAGGNHEAGPSGVKSKRSKQGNDNSDPQIDHLSKSCAIGSGAENLSTRANWKDPELLRLFLDLCLEEAAKRRTVVGNLTRQSWEKIQAVFRDSKGFDLTKDQLLNEWNILRKKYAVWSKIIAQAKESQYDPVTNKINWNQTQWEEYIKVFSANFYDFVFFFKYLDLFLSQTNPDAKPFRYKSLEYPEKMKAIFDSFGNP